MTLAAHLFWRETRAPSKAAAHRVADHHTPSHYNRQPAAITTVNPQQSAEDGNNVPLLFSFYGASISR